MSTVDKLLSTFVVDLDNAIGESGTDSALTALRDLVAAVWVQRGTAPAGEAQVVELVVALDEALGLADTPERDQDEQWYARRKVLGELCNRHEAACSPEALAAARSAS